MNLQSPNILPDQPTMIVQVIEGRYTVDHVVLKSCLEGLFKEGNFKIIVSVPEKEGVFD